MFNYWLLLIPALSTLIGWLSIKIAVKLVFHPQQPKKIFGISFQGILPRNQKLIAAEAGKYAAASFSLDTIEQKIKDPKNFDQVRPLIETHIDDFLRHKLKEQMPMIGMFIGDKTIQSLKTIFIQEIESLFPQVMQQFAGNLKKEINIEALISGKLESMSPAVIEKAVSGKFRPALILGGLIGLVMGLIQFAILWFAL